MVKHAEDLVKGQPRVIGLSRVGGLPLVFEVPKLGGSAEMKKGRRETGVRETNRQTETETDGHRGDLSHTSHLHHVIWMEGRSGTSPWRGAF